MNLNHLPPVPRSEPQTRAFTLTDLLATLLMIGLVTLSLSPALARTRPNCKTIQCQNNLHQLALAWSAYAADFGDRVANNFGVSETYSTMSDGHLANWANNVMSWTAESINTNLPVLTNGVMGSYLRGSVTVYRCPADTYLSSVQRAAGWTARTRSVSMNSVFGRFSTGSDPTASGMNWGFTQYAQYLKQARVPKPARTWLFIDEHPDSINDGYFINNPSVTSWQDIPSAFHESGCSLAFTDGHAELRRWQSPTSWYPVQYNYPYQRTFDALGRADSAWLLSRTGWMELSTGRLMFGY